MCGSGIRDLKAMGGGQMGQIEQWMYTNWKYSMKKITVLVGVESPEEAGTQPGG